MPEVLEAEIWCRAAGVVVGRRVVDAWVDERVAPVGCADELIGAGIESVTRRGKVVLVALDTGRVLGLHFGMTGRLVVDGVAPIERLEYASGRDESDWDRLRLWTAAPSEAVPALRLNDPRRLGRISLDPDLSSLGPEVFDLTAEVLGGRLRRRRGPIKNLLLDQSVVAGLGNLCADEVLFTAGVAPTRPADELDVDDRESIAAACRDRLPEMLAAGGSTHGRLDPDVRAAAGACPLDGHPLERTRLAGRTAVWCRAHQR